MGVISCSATASASIFSRLPETFNIPNGATWTQYSSSFGYTDIDVSVNSVWDLSKLTVANNSGSGSANKDGFSIEFFNDSTVRIHGFPYSTYWSGQDSFTLTEFSGGISTYQQKSVLLIGHSGSGSTVASQVVALSPVNDIDKVWIDINAYGALVRPISGTPGNLIYVQNIVKGGTSAAPTATITYLVTGNISTNNNYLVCFTVAETL